MEEYRIDEKIPVAVLGATGSVGQRFIQLLDNHPFFEVVALTGSEKRVGQVYGENCNWILSEEMPLWASSMTLKPSSPYELNVPLAFSALPSKYAITIEPEFAKAGCAVFSNAGAFRREPDVPILLPEINPSHINLLETQKRNRMWSGFIVTNPNCTSTGISIVLNALNRRFGVKKCFAVSMQAISGAGYPGVASLDIIDNVIPFIKDEEEKLEWEPRKILGDLMGKEIFLANFQISAHCNRVAVSDGHMACLSIKLNQPLGEEKLEKVIEALVDFDIPKESKDLPSSPSQAIYVLNKPERPQPRLDRDLGGGMSTVVGRIRRDTLLDIKMVVLSHNTIRGAAGGSIYNAELLLKAGYVG